MQHCNQAQNQYAVQITIDPEVIDYSDKGCSSAVITSRAWEEQMTNPVDL